MTTNKGTNGPPVAIPVSLASVAAKGSEATLTQHSDTLLISRFHIASHDLVLSAGTISSDVKLQVMVSTLVRASDQLVGAELAVPARTAIKKMKAEDESESDCSIGFGPASKLQRSPMSDGDEPGAAPDDAAADVKTKK